MVETIIRVNLKTERERRDTAASIAKAAESRVSAGQIEKAVENALNVRPRPRNLQNQATG